MKPGDLAGYMSSVILIVDTGPTGKNSANDWIYGIELGESSIGKYRRHALVPIKDQSFDPKKKVEGN